MKTPPSLPLGPGVQIVNTHPAGLIGLFKPAGILSHPNKPSDSARALLSWPYDPGEQVFVEPGGAGKVWLLNRLDSATSGVLLCASEKDAADLVKRLFAENRVRKKYYALVFGAMRPPVQQWRDRLAVAKKDGRLRATTRGGAPAETVARLRRVHPGLPPLALLELEPKTGRTHQLRVQCARRDLPIVGDQTYGKYSWNRAFARGRGSKRLFLHSAEIAVTAKLGGERFSFVAAAPLPPEFNPK